MRNHPAYRVLAGLAVAAFALVGCTSVDGSAAPDPAGVDTTTTADTTVVTSLPPDKVVPQEGNDEGGVVPVDTLVDPEAYHQPDLSAYAWKSPTGNIRCEFFQAPQIALTCTVMEHQLTPATGCAAGQPATASITQGVAQQGCRGDVPLDGPVLEYGQTIDLDNFSCTSAEDGMTCLAGTQSFLISRATIDIQN